MTPNRHEYILAWADAQGRPVMVPTKAPSPRQLQKGEPNTTLGGLPVCVDNQIPTPSSGSDQVLIGDLSMIYVWAPSSPTFRVMPTSVGAGQMSVTITVYGYHAAIPQFKSAFATISGSGMTTAALS